MQGYLGGGRGASGKESGGGEMAQKWAGGQGRDGVQEGQCEKQVCVCVCEV